MAVDYREAENEIKALKLEFKLTKTYATRDMRFQRVSPLEWTITTTTQNQCEAYLQIKKINNVNVQVTRNEILNYSYGTIAIPYYHEITNENEKQELLETWKR